MHFSIIIIIFRHFPGKQTRYSKFHPNVANIFPISFSFNLNSNPSPVIPTPHSPLVNPYPPSLTLSLPPSPSPSPKGGGEGDVRHRGRMHVWARSSGEWWIFVLSLRLSVCLSSSPLSCFSLLYFLPFLFFLFLPLFLLSLNSFFLSFSHILSFLRSSFHSLILWLRPSRSLIPPRPLNWLGGVLH